MAGSSQLRASFLLRLEDRVSGGIGAIQRRFQALQGVMQRLNGFRDLARNMAGVGLVASALTFAGPVASAAQLDQQLRDITLTTGRTGAEVGTMIARLQGEFGDLALATGQSTRQIADGVGQMLAAGLDEKSVTGLAPTIARTATAANAAIADIAALGIAAQQNLNIRPEGMYGALASLAQAGKEGSFELRAMAQYLPELTGQLKALGMTGRGSFDSIGAALQVVKREAGSDGQAATNMRSLLNSFVAPDVEKKFSEMGVNLAGVLQSARRQGIDPLEAVMAQMQRLIREAKGDAAGVLGKLFGDAESRNAARALMGNTADFRRIRQAARGAGEDVLTNDFNTQMAGMQRQLNQITEMTAQLGDRMGQGVFDSFIPILPTLRRLHAGMKELDATFPGVVDGTIAWVGGAFLLAGALGTLALIAPTIVTGFTMIGAVLGALMAPLRLVMTLLTGLGVGATAAALVVAALAAALVAAALHIYRNWDRFRGFFAALWSGVREVFAGFVAWVAGWFTGNSASRAAAVMRMWEGLKGAFSALWEIVKGLFSDFIGWVDSWTGGAVTTAITGFKNLWNGLSTWAANDLWPAVTAEFNVWADTARGWVDQQVQDIVSRFRNAWSGLTGFFTGLWQGITAGFNTFIAPIQSAIERVQRFRGRGEAPAAPGMTSPALPGTTPGVERPGEDPVLTRRPVSADGWGPMLAPGMGRAQPATAGAAPFKGDLSVTVRAEKGAEVVEARTETPGLTVNRERRGPMLGRA